MCKGPAVTGDGACAAEVRDAVPDPTGCDLNLPREASSNGPILPTTIQTSTLPPSIAEDITAGADETLAVTSLKQATKTPETGAPAAVAPPKQSSGGKISLSRWSLVVVPNNPGITRLDRSVTEDWIVLVGRRPDMAEMWHSSLITGRISEREITTGSGRIYSLEGPADELALIEAGFSFETVEAFKLGFPESWQLVLIQEFGNAKSRVGEHPETPRSLTAGATLVAPKKRSRQAQDPPNLCKPTAPKEEEPTKALSAVSIRDGDPGKGAAGSAGASSVQPVKRGRGRPPKAKSGGPRPKNSITPSQPKGDYADNAKENDCAENARVNDHVQNVRENDHVQNVGENDHVKNVRGNDHVQNVRGNAPRPQHQEDTSSLAKTLTNPGITSPRSYVSLGGKIVATPPTLSERSPGIKASGPPLGDRETGKANSSGKKRRGSEASSRWCDLPESPLSTISGTDISILGRTRSGRRVVAPLPYWENKYVRSIPSASQSPILRLKPPAGAR